MFSCRICGVYILYTLHHISQHSRQQHELTGSAYAEAHLGLKKSFWRQLINNEPHRPSPQPSKKKKKKGAAGALVPGSSPVDLSQLCLCECTLCGKQVLHHQMPNHAKFNHGGADKAKDNYKFIRKTYYRQVHVDS